MQAATDSEYDQLRRENIATILSYGDAFMDLVCRDACDGLDVGRVCLASVTIVVFKWFYVASALDHVTDRKGSTVAQW